MLWAVLGRRVQHKIKKSKNQSYQISIWPITLVPLLLVQSNHQRRNGRGQGKEMGMETRSQHIHLHM